jgi:hypothetical protein
VESCRIWGYLTLPSIEVKPRSAAHTRVPLLLSHGIRGRGMAGYPPEALPSPVSIAHQPGVGDWTFTASFSIMQLKLVPRRRSGIEGVAMEAIM